MADRPKVPCWQPSGALRAVKHIHRAPTKCSHEPHACRAQCPLRAWHADGRFAPSVQPATCRAASRRACARIFQNMQPDQPVGIVRRPAMPVTVIPTIYMQVRCTLGVCLTKRNKAWTQRNEVFLKRERSTLQRYCPLVRDHPGTILVSGTQVPGSGSNFFSKCYR
eukprot:SAG11_NODE_36_length_21869_cov_38.038999_9_plen_166_part_00